MSKDKMYETFNLSKNIIAAIQKARGQRVDFTPSQLDETRGIYDELDVAALNFLNRLLQSADYESLLAEGRNLYQRISGLFSPRSQENT